MPWGDPVSPRRYSVSARNQTVAGASTLVLIHTLVAADPLPPGYAVAIIRAWCKQTGTTTPAQQEIRWFRKLATFPTLVSSDPKATRPGFDPPSGLVGATTGAAGTTGVNASAEGGGAETVLWDDAFNNIIGYDWIAAGPDDYLVIGPDVAIGLKFPTAPAAGFLAGWTFGLTYIEIDLAGY
jgi:hypothetical protein